MSDPLAPLTRRLKELSRDANNAVSSVLALFAGIREQGRPRQEVKLEIFRLKAQLARVESAFSRLDEVLGAMESHAGELSEQELIGLVDKIADAGTIAEHTATVLALDYIATAVRLLKTQPDKFFEIIREMDSHEGGREQVQAFCKAAIDYYQGLSEED